MQISATIISLNEADNIRDCLESLQFVDEIIVVDSGSTDRTEEICRSFPNVRFFHQSWLGYGKQKNYAANLAQYDWILNLDADERVSVPLRQSIEQTVFVDFSAARMARENYFGDCWIKYCGWYPDYNTRLYNRRQCKFSERLVHETLECEGVIATLHGNLVHRSYRNISDYIQRMDRYSSLAAQELVSNGKTPGLIAMIVHSSAMFVKMYFLRRGFLQGGVGLLLSVLYAQYTFCKYAKAREQSAACTSEKRFAGSKGQR